MSKDKEQKINGQDDKSLGPNKAVESSTQPPKPTKPEVAKKVVKPVFPKGPGVHIRTGLETFKKVKPVNKESGDEPGEK